MLKPSLCNYNDAEIQIKGTMTIPNTGAAAVLNNVKVKSEIK